MNQPAPDRLTLLRRRLARLEARQLVGAVLIRGVRRELAQEESVALAQQGTKVDPDRRTEPKESE